LALGRGLALKPETKINAVRGLKDLTTYTLGFARRAKRQREEHSGALGQHIVKGENANVRTFGVRMSHVRPFFHSKELRRIQTLVGVLENLQRNNDTPHGLGA